MSISKWKELADRKAKTGQMKRNLFDEITEEKIRSKTTDQAIAKTFRLDRLDQIAEQTKPKPRRRIQIPRINREGGIDYAPEVDPYEDMDVEGLLNLENVAPQAEKQIAKIPSDPPPLYEETDPLAIAGLSDDLEAEDKFVDATDEEDEEEEYDFDEELKLWNEDEPNRILDQLDLPNYIDVDNRLAKPEITANNQRNYLTGAINDAESRRKTLTVRKSIATKAYKAGKITEEYRDLIHENVSKREKDIADYKTYLRSKRKSITGSGVRRGQRGRGAYFFNDAKEMLQKLTLIIAEMEAGNTSIKMRNMGQTILDALLHENHINKGQYRQLVKKIFRFMSAEIKSPLII